jgi:hypothetical protein
MVPRKRMTRPILSINSEIVEERILGGDQQDRVLASYTTLQRLSIIFISVIPLVTYYVISVKHGHADTAAVYF